MTTSAAAAFLVCLAACPDRDKADYGPANVDPEAPTLASHGPAEMSLIPPDSRKKRTQVRQWAAPIGDLDSAVIRRVMQALEPSARRCVDERMQSAPDFRAVPVLVTFKIGPIRNIVAPSATGDQTVASCLVALIRATKLPTNHGWIEISHWFMFDEP